MASFQIADSLATAIYNKIKSTICNLIYPVGSIKMTVTNTNPSTYLGGTWSLWGAGRVPVGIDADQTEFNTSEKTGGEKTHELTIEELAKHTHTYQRTIYNAGTNGFLSQDGKAGIGGSYTTGETGESKPHNNLQPYITCYMWKRTS